MRDKTALVVIDVQRGMFDEVWPVFDGDGLLDRLSNLIGRARKNGVSVVYVQHNEGPGGPLETGSPGWEVHPAIAPLDGDIVVQKRTPDSFYETILQDELTKLGVTRLVISGMQTEVCVDTTTRRAFSLGYDVVLVEDAHGTYDSETLKAQDIIAHHNSVLRWFATPKASGDIEF